MYLTAHRGTFSGKMQWENIKLYPDSIAQTALDIHNDSIIGQINRAPTDEIANELSYGFYAECIGGNRDYHRIIFVSPYLCDTHYSGDFNSTEQDTADSNWMIFDTCGGLCTIGKLVYTSSLRKACTYHRLNNIKVEEAQPSLLSLGICKKFNVFMIGRERACIGSIVYVEPRQRNPDFGPARFPYYTCFSSLLSHYNSITQCSGISCITWTRGPQGVERRRDMVGGMFKTIKITDHRFVGRKKEYEVEWSGPSTMFDKVYEPTWVENSLLTNSSAELIKEYNASFDSPGNETLSKATALLLCLTEGREKRDVSNGVGVSIIREYDVPTFVGLVTRRMTAANAAFKAATKVQCIPTDGMSMSGDWSQDGVSGINAWETTLTGDIRLGRTGDVSKLRYSSACKHNVSPRKRDDVTSIYEVCIITQEVKDPRDTDPKDIHSFNTYVLNAFAVPFMDGGYSIQRNGSADESKYTVACAVTGTKGKTYTDNTNNVTYALHQIKCTLDCANDPDIGDVQRDPGALTCVFVDTNNQVSNNAPLQNAIEVRVYDIVNGNADHKGDQISLLNDVLHGSFNFFYGESEEENVVNFFNHVNNMLLLMFVRKDFYWMDFHTFSNDDPVSHELNGQPRAAYHTIYKLIGSDVHRSLKGEDVRKAYVDYYKQNCIDAIDRYCEKCDLLGNQLPKEITVPDRDGNASDLGREYHVYYPYSMFGDLSTNTVSAGEMHYGNDYYETKKTAKYKMLTAYIDRVMLVGKKVVIVEYKCLMCKHTTSKLVLGRVTSNEVRRQVLMNATLFHLCTGIKPDYVMTVHCTRAQRDRGADLHCENAVTELDTDDLSVTVCTAENRAMSRRTRRRLTDKRETAVWTGNIETLNEYIKNERPRRTMPTEPTVTGFVDLVLGSICIGTAPTHVFTYEGPGKWKPSALYRDIIFKDKISQLLKIERDIDGNVNQVCACSPNQWRRWRKRRSVRAYVQMHEYSYDNSHFQNRHKFVERLLTNPLGVHRHKQNRKSETFPRVVYCDDRYLIPCLHEMLSLRPAKAMSMLFDEERHYTSLRWSLPGMRIMTEFVNNFDILNDKAMTRGIDHTTHRLLCIKKITLRKGSTNILKFDSGSLDQSMILVEHEIFDKQPDHPNYAATTSKFVIRRVEASPQKPQSAMSCKPNPKCHFFVLLPHETSDTDALQYTRVQECDIFGSDRRGARREDIVDGVNQANDSFSLFSLFGTSSHADVGSGTQLSAVQKIIYLDNMQKALNDEVLAASTLLYDEIVEHCEKENLDPSLRDLWDCMLLYYDVIHSFENQQTGNANPNPTLQFMFQADLDTDNRTSKPSYTIGHHYTGSQDRYLTSMQALGRPKMMKQICTRSIHRLVNQRIMQIFVPLKITRPELIFDQTSHSDAKKNACFAAMRGLHLSEPEPRQRGTAGDEEAYRTLYQEHRSSVIEYDSSFRVTSRNITGNRGGGGGGGGDKTDAPRRPFVGKSSVSSSHLRSGRETWCDSKRHEHAKPVGEISRIPFIKMAMPGSAHYKHGYVLDLFCHDSQRGEWSKEALEEALRPIAHLGNFKPVELAAADLLNHFVHTIDLVIQQRNNTEDERIVSILETLCREYGIL